MAGVLISNLEYFAQAESKPNKRPNSVAQIKCGTLGDFGCLPFSPASLRSLCPFPVQHTNICWPSCSGRCSSVVMAFAARCIYHLARTKGPFEPLHCNSNCGQKRAVHWFPFCYLDSINSVPAAASGGRRAARGGGGKGGTVGEATLRQRQTK